MILGLVDEAVKAGARQSRVCRLLGLAPRTLERWRAQEIGEDRRAGPKTSPGNKLSPAEEKRVLETVNSPEFRDLSPKQLVPILADQGIYLASESTVYRILRRQDQVNHRSPIKPPSKRYRPEEKVATGPNQVWSWDITYLKGPIRGTFFFLYLIMDVWSRKIVGWEVHESELGEHASRLFEKACAQEGIEGSKLTVHAAGGGPMKGSTLLTTLQRLGVVPSFSRPRASDDNPYSEALFRTLKPEYPREAFASLEEARRWVALFVEAYNTEHRHSAIKFLTPEERHLGLQEMILTNRQQVYEQARQRHPERWTGKTRDWSPIEVVRLNPDPETKPSKAA